jgi:hypothetical protein
MKKFKLPQGDFLHNFLQQQRVGCHGGIGLRHFPVALPH